MSHGILEHDTVKATEKCWHGLESIIPLISFPESGLDWTVVANPICDMEGNRIYGWNQITCNDKPLTLQIATDSYEPIQNKRVFDAIENSLAGVNHRITCAGSLHNRRRIFISIDLDNDQPNMVGRDAFKSRLTFLTSHDGSMSFQMFDNETRVVCANTMNVAMSEKRNANIRFNVKHTANAEAKIENMEKHIEQALTKRDTYYAQLQRLQSIEMSEQEQKAVIASTYIKKEDASTRALNRAREIIRLAKQGRGNRGETAYDVLNGSTEYWTHSAHKNDRVKNWVSSDFGTGAQRKTEMLYTLSNDAKRQEAIEHGRELVAQLA